MCLFVSDTGFDDRRCGGDVAVKQVRIIMFSVPPLPGALHYDQRPDAIILAKFRDLELRMSVVDFMGCAHVNLGYSIWKMLSRCKTALLHRSQVECGTGSTMATQQSRA